MKMAPPKFLESLVRSVLPPARREQVLGDIHERYKSPLKYIADAANVVPAAIFSQLRRATPIAFRLLEALVIYGSIFADARLSEFVDGPPDPSQVARLTLVSLAGLVWHDVYYVRPPASKLITQLELDFHWVKWVRNWPFMGLYAAMVLPCFVLEVAGSLSHHVRALLSLPRGINYLGLLIASISICLLRRWIERRRLNQLTGTR